MLRNIKIVCPRTALISLLVTSVSFTSWAQATNPPATKLVAHTVPVVTNQWSGPVVTKEFDWIELTSGEWLKGELKSMQEKILEFDSDKLGLLKLDWEDVRQVRAERPQTVITERKDEYTGLLHIDEAEVRVTLADGTAATFDRPYLLGLVPGEPKELNYWSLKLGAGATYQTGNTKRSDLNINGRIQRRTPDSRLLLSYLGVYTTTDEVETANNHRANGSFDIFLTRRLFVRPVFAEYFRDKFQNIEHQLTVGMAVGYTLIDNGRTTWDIFGGPGYRYTRFVSVLPGERSDESTAAFLGGSTWDREMTTWMDANASYQFGLMNERSGTYTHHATAGLSIELTSHLDLDLTAVWDHISTPQQRSDGTTPLPDDFRFIVGVSLDL